MNWRGFFAKRRLAALILLLVILPTGLWAAKISYGLVRWKSYIWVPSYLATALTAEDPIPQGIRRHVIFLMCDHYEPGRGEPGFRTHSAWLEKFLPIADRHRDSNGNRFVYTWFYAFDHHNDAVIASLHDAVMKGHGEVEFHWHHPPSNNENFPRLVDEAVSWFRAHGLMGGADPATPPRFAFIHGNWALDGSQTRCSVSRELSILASKGCYADFTFSTIGTISQPRKTNSIYYASDTDAPKSYDTGLDAAVGGSPGNGFLIFEGPLTIDWKGNLEYGAVESYALPNQDRVNAWIDAAIHVHGRPEWVFVKVYTHGIQSASALLNGSLEQMLTDVETVTRERGMTLHYMTAREAFNVVKAAEAGRSGDPESYRDFLIPAPQP